MIRIKLSKERKLIIGIGAILLLLGGIYRLGPLTADLGEGGAEIEINKQKIVKYVQRIQEGPVLEGQRRALIQNLEQLQKGLLKGQTPALSAVTLQNLINEIAGNIGVEPKSTRVLKAEEIDKNRYVSVPVQVSLELTMSQLKQLLYKVESSIIYLRVTKLQLRKKSDSQPIQLQATITIEGIMSEDTQG